MQFDSFNFCVLLYNLLFPEVHIEAFMHFKEFCYNNIRVCVWTKIGLTEIF